MEENTQKQEKEIKKSRENIKKLLEEETKLKEEYLDHLQRLQAEFQNYQKKIEQEKLEFIKYAKQDLILKLLGIIDNFERALSNKENKEEFSKGIELIFKQLKSTLEKEGVREIKEDYFDFDKHEAIAIEEGEENRILGEFQKGYTLHDKVIRTSKVKVGKGGKNESAISSSEE